MLRFVCKHLQFIPVITAEADTKGKRIALFFYITSKN